MKKKSATILIIFFLSIGIFYYLSLPDYHVFNSMSFSNQDTRDTKLQVIVYQYWGIDELVQEIQEEHDKINGTPTTLEINLYYSKWHLRSGKEPFKTVLFKNK